MCDAVCSEPGVPSSTLKARASALKTLGTIFQVASLQQLFHITQCTLECLEVLATIPT